MSDWKETAICLRKGNSDDIDIDIDVDVLIVRCCEFRLQFFRQPR